MIDTHQQQDISLSTESVRESLAAVVEERKSQLDPPAGQFYEAIYETPYQAHLTMEPMNCTAHIADRTAQIWAPTQNPQGVVSTGGSGCVVHVPLIGCGLGRRLSADYVPEAVELSRETGAPIKVVWTREDGVQHDTYGPTSYHYRRAELNADGLPEAWLHITAGQDNGIAHGAGPNPYTIQERIYAANKDIPVVTGYWRAVWNNQMAFARECFVDELAVHARQDPY